MAGKYRIKGTLLPSNGASGTRRNVTKATLRSATL
jgi:hypothetical protein